MTEHSGGGDADVFGIIERNTRGSGVPKQVRIDCPSQSFALAPDNANVDPIVVHWRTIHRQPERVRAAAAQGCYTRSVWSFAVRGSLTIELPSCPAAGRRYFPECDILDHEDNV